MDGNTAGPVNGSPQDEVILTGGDVTEGVVRVGDTVRRPPPHHAAIVHAVLRHLERVGFDGAPRYLGTDDRGRDILTFLDGETAGQVLPGWVADDARLASVARLTRAYDDAVSGFVPPEGTPEWAPALAAPEDAPPMPPYPTELWGHVDITPQNVVFDAAGEAVGLIDFDLLRPATRVDEVVNVLRHWAPLGDPVDAPPALRDVDVLGRVRLVADAYGLSDRDRGRVWTVASMTLARSWHTMRRYAEVFGGGWQRMWDEGLGDRLLRASAWVDAHRADLETAVRR